ncbi:MAG: hypothetical protein HPY83_06370 [Anaerolineae bacterium]|nr:hypothetical protein [Anaerolineae bacterium]
MLTRIRLILALPVGLLAILALVAGPVLAQTPPTRPMPTTVPGSEGDGALAAAGSSYANLVIEAVEVLPAAPLVGRMAEIRVTVSNTGTGHPTDGRGNPANFWVDLFVDPPVARAEDLLSMPGYPPTASEGVQSNWLAPGQSYVVKFELSFAESGMHDLYAVVDIAELDLPIGNVDEGGAAAESDNAYGPRAVEVRRPNVIVAKDNADFVRGPASSLAIVPVLSARATPVATPAPIGSSDRSVGSLSLSFGDTALSLGYFEGNPVYSQGTLDPMRYNLVPLDRKLSDDSSGRPQQSARIAAVEGLVVAVWEDRRNSALTSWDIYLTWSDNQGRSWRRPYLGEESMGSGQVNDPESTDYDQRHPALAIGTDEVGQTRVLVVWQDNRNGKYEVWGQWYAYVLMGSTLQLSPVGSNFPIAAAPSANCLTPDVAAATDARVRWGAGTVPTNWYVTWREDYSDGGSRIWMRSFFFTDTDEGGEDGGRWEPPRRVGDAPGLTYQQSPRVTAGRVYLPTFLGFAAECQADGRPNPQFEVIELEPVVVAWEDLRAENGLADDGVDSDIYWTFSVDGGRTFAVDRILNDDKGSDPLAHNGIAQAEPAIGLGQSSTTVTLEDKSGRCSPSEVTYELASVAVYFTWQDFRNSQNHAMDNNPDIYLARVDIFRDPANPALWRVDAGANEKLNRDSDYLVAGSAWQGHPDLTVRNYDAPGSVGGKAIDVFIVWADGRNHGQSNVDVYMTVRGDLTGCQEEVSLVGDFQVNSGVHVSEAQGPGFADASQDPPAAQQMRPAVAADIQRSIEGSDPFSERRQLCQSKEGYVYVVWDDNRDLVYDRDVFLARSNLTYSGGYDRLYPSYDGLVCHYGSGSYISPVFDLAATDVRWDRIEWNAETPVGTFVTLQTRLSSDPDSLVASQWQPSVRPYESVGVPIQGYSTSGQPIVDAEGNLRPQGRYVQFRVNMWTRTPLDPAKYCVNEDERDSPVAYNVPHTPILYSVSLHYEGGPPQVYLPLAMKNSEGGPPLNPDPSIPPTSCSLLPSSQVVRFKGALRSMPMEARLTGCAQASELVDYWGRVYHAGGVYVLVFMEVTNRGTESDDVGGLTSFRIADSQGRLFDMADVMVQLAAEYTYNLEGTYDRIQPGFTSHMVFVFDIHPSSASLSLVSSSPW